LCRKHYERNRKHGDPLYVGRPGRPARQCVIPDCGEPRVGDGLCRKHYMRRDRHGDPLATKRIIGDDEARWWSYVDRRGDDECWPWTGSTDKRSGYGMFSAGGKTFGAHAWAYKHFVGEVPPGWQVDHVRTRGCAMRHCVNYLRHLEAVTSRENCLRGARTKLSDADVTGLLARIASGEHFADLAWEIGVNKSTLTRRVGMLVISQLEKGERTVLADVAIAVKAPGRPAAATS
jgi:hypothetical protein